MKVFAVFGSASDSPVFEPLLSELSKDYQVEHRVISAHRNHAELAQALKTLDYDLVVAGAGLAAHLPGVVAAQTLKPVIGIPVNSQFQGLDSFLSIAQMPAGVSVLCFAEKNFGALHGFLKMPVSDGKAVVVVPPSLESWPETAKEIARIKDYAQRAGWELSFTQKATRKTVEIEFCDILNPQNLSNGAITIPIVQKENLNKADTALKLFEVAKKIGVWVGVNNSRNAFLSLVQLACKNRNNLFLESARRNP